MKRKAKVFLSYAHSDKQEVLKLYDKLKAVDLSPWIDTKDIFAGQKWEQSILAAIRKSDFFLACLTSKSVNKRGFLQKEISTAYDIRQMLVDDDVYFIPVKLENCSVPDPLNTYQWIDLFEPDGWQSLLTSRNNEIKRRLRNVGPATLSPDSGSSSASKKAKHPPNRITRVANKESRQGSAPTKTLQRRRVFSADARNITEDRLPQEWLSELNLFRRAITRTRIINGPRMNLFSNTDPRNLNIRIATISTNLHVAQLDEKEHGDYRVWLVESKYRKQLREEFLKHLKQAPSLSALTSWRTQLPSIRVQVSL